MFDELEQLLFHTFMLVIRIGMKVTWALLRPALPDIIRGVLTLLIYPLSWSVMSIAALWAFTDHTLIPSLVAAAALVTVFMSVALRPHVIR